MSRVDADAAQIQVLEAVLLAVVMLGAIGFVLSFDLPSSATEPAREGLERRATDALSVLGEFPSDQTQYGGTMLSYAVARAMEGDPTTLETRLRDLLPPATKFRVDISNGERTRNVYSADGDPRGETVTASYLVEPEWAYSFVGTDASLYGSPTTLGVYALPTYNSNVVTDGGVPVVVTATLRRNGLEWEVKGAYTTVQGGRDAGGLYLSSNVYGWDDTNSVPKAFYDRIDPGTGQYNGNKYVHLRLCQNDDGTIPAGTPITIRVPQGQDASFGTSAGAGIVDGDWIPDPAFSSVDSTTGGTLKATTKNALTGAGACATFEFTSAYESAVREYDFYVLDVTVGGPRAYGKAEIVLHDHKSDTFTGGDYTAVYASVPKPMGIDTETTWTVVVVNAAMTSFDSSDKVYLTKVEIEQPDGLDIFAEVNDAKRDGVAVTWTVEDGGSKVQWAGNQLFGAYTGMEFVLDVKANAVPTTDQSREYLSVPVTVPTPVGVYAQEVMRQIEPGLFYGQIPPFGTGMGYDTTNSVAGTPHAIDVAPRYDPTLTLDGEWHYHASVATLKDLLSTVSVDVDDRTVVGGDAVTIDINAKSAITTMNLRGIPVRTFTRIYEPWSISGHHIAYGPIESSDTAAANRDVTAVVATDLTGDNIQDLVVATNEGKIIAFDVAAGGATISGLTKTFTDQPVTSLATFTTGGQPYIVAGLGKDTGARNSLSNLYVYDKDLKSVLAAASFDGGTVPVVDVAAGFNLDNAGPPDYLVGNEGATSGAYDGDPVDDGTPTAAQKPFPNWPNDGEGALASYVEFGVTGPLKTPTAIVTTGLDAQVSYDRVAEYPDSTNEGGLTGAALDAVKRVSINTGTDALYGFDHQRNRVWSLPVAGIEAMQATDINGDGTTDVVAGTWDGYLYAVNGRQAALPWLGVTILSGSTFLDADFVDINHGWMVDTSGFTMRTVSGHNTRDYTNGVPGAGPQAFGVDLINVDVGYAVGAANNVWKTTDGGRTAAAELHTIKDPTGLIEMFPTGTWGTSDYRDVEFWDLNNGVIVGTACTGCAGESTPIYTTDGGATWKSSKLAASAGAVLYRVHWSSADQVFAVGSDGTVLRSKTDALNGPAGAYWETKSPLGVGLTDSFHGIDCVTANECWLVGTNGLLYYTTDGGDNWVKKTIDATVDGVTVALRDVDFRDAMNGIVVGDSTLVMKTDDGGLTWVRQPGAGPLAANWQVVTNMGPDAAYFFGGNAETRSYGITSSYESSAFAETTTIASMPTTDAVKLDPRFERVKIVPESYNNEYTSVVYSVSADGGANWRQLVPTDPTQLDLLGKRKYDMQTVGVAGNDLRMKFELGVNLDYTMHTPIIRGVAITYEWSWKCGVVDPNPGATSVSGCESLGYTCDAATGRCTEQGITDAGIDDGSLKHPDSSKTTAEWQATNADGSWEIRLPRIQKLWTAYVGGRVNSLDADVDVTGDGYKDVVVAVGPKESPLGVKTGDVNQVFLYDGQDGALLRSFGLAPNGLLLREPWRVQYADVDTAGSGKGTTEILVGIFEHLDANDDGDTILKVLNANFAELASLTYEGRPDVLFVTDHDKTDAVVNDDFVLGTTSGSNAVGSTVPGYARLFASVDPDPDAAAWREIVMVSPDAVGDYVVSWTVPRDQMYGPHVVETELTWTETGGRTVKIGDDVFTLPNEVQSLYLLDYFVVTPKDGLSVRPVYTVQLTVWFEDWDFARD